MIGGMKKTATSKSAMARWKRSQLTEVFIAFFFSITAHTRKLPAMLKIITAATDSEKTKEKVDIAILEYKIKFVSQSGLFL